MSEEKVTINIDGEIVEQLKKLSHQELVEKLVLVCIDGKIATEKIKELQAEIDRLNMWLKQSRQVIQNIVDSWR